MYSQAYHGKRQKSIKKFNGLIPLITNIIKDFTPDILYCLVEADYDPIDYNNETNNVVDNDNKIRNIVYSGTLNELSGIELIISAMNIIEDKNIF